jgi:hypothetical protein
LCSEPDCADLGNREFYRRSNLCFLGSKRCSFLVVLVLLRSSVFETDAKGGRMEADTTCSFCGEAINRDSPEVYQHMRGYENGDRSVLVVAEWLDDYGCARCIAEGEPAEAPDPPPDLPSSAL